MIEFADVRAVLTEETGTKEYDIHPSTPLRSLLTDSLEFANLILELEDTIGREIPEDEAQKLVTVDDVLIFANICRIRAARDADLDRIVALGQQSLAEGTYREHIADNPAQVRRFAEQLLASPRQARILVAERGGKVCGLFAFFIFPHYFSGEMTASELIWYVEPEARVGGTSLKLLAAAEQLARELGALRMQLTAPTPEIAALYARCGGYQQIETAFLRKL